MAHPIATFLEGIFRALSEDPATAGVHWTAREAVIYVNDFLLLLAEVRPDALAQVTAAHPLVAGTTQGLPAGAFQLFDVLANGAGEAVRLVDRKMLDASLPTWRSATAGQPTNYTFDESQPDTFEVYPPAPSSGATVKLRAAHYATPITLPLGSAAPTTVTGDLPFDDELVGAAREYVLYRCKSIDADFAPGVVAAAQTHLMQCARSLGVELAASQASSPKAAKGA